MAYFLCTSVVQSCVHVHYGMVSRFSVPDTYIIIFFVVVLAAIVTFFVPKGYYETQDVTYMMNGVEKTRTVIKDGSFQYLTDDAGKAVTEGVTLFSGDGESGFS